MGWPETEQGSHWNLEVDVISFFSMDSSLLMHSVSYSTRRRIKSSKSSNLTAHLVQVNYFSNAQEPYVASG